MAASAMAPPTHTVIRNGLLLDIAGHKAPPADILIAGDTIAAIGAPGLAAPPDAGPYINGHRSLEDKYISGLLGGLDMIRSGTTACYDLMHEFPLPTAEGLAAAARGYGEAGLRTVLAPMVADHSFF